jgi:quinolinate synthase
MIEPSDLIELKRRNPDHLVMCYVNSTAEIKALSDVCCTSSNAVKIASRLADGRGIIFVPDKYLGSFVQERTGRSMILWNGFCPTHARIEPSMILDARAAHPDAAVMIHPEAPPQCRQLCDQILSTGGMCDFVKSSDKREFVVATENGILHTLARQNPSKRFFTVSDHITCPNMKLGSALSVKRALSGEGGEVIAVAPEIAKKARVALERMLELSA